MTSTAMACENLAREALEPCPFCGGNAQVIEAERTFCVQCTAADCYAAVGENYDHSAMPDHIYANEEAAIAAWNRRARTAYDAIGSGVEADSEEQIARAILPTVWQMFDEYGGRLNPSAEADRKGSLAQARRVLSCLSTHTAAGAGPVGEAVAEAVRDELLAHGEFGASAHTSRANALEAAKAVIAMIGARPVEKPGEVERLRAEAHNAHLAVKEERALTDAAEAALAETRERLEKLEADSIKAATAHGELESLVVSLFAAEAEYDAARRHERGDRQSRDTVVRSERAYDHARFKLKKSVAALTGDAQEAGK